MTFRARGEAGEAPLPSGEDLQLVDALRRGDESAFSRLVAALQPAMMHLARRHLRSSHTAEEAVQDTWVAVFRGVRRFESKSSLRTWIFGILINRVRSVAQREWRDARSACGAASSAVPPPIGDDPAAALVEGETRRALARAISGLPPTQRAVLTLREIEGLTGEEVRELLQVSPGNQRVILHRARARLRRAMNSPPEGGGRRGT